MTTSLSTNLDGRVAVITGGAGHLGFAMAESLAAAGAKVGLLDIDGKKTAERARDLTARFSVPAFALTADLADESLVRAIPEQLRVHTDRLDILIHCAALVGSSELKGWAVPFEQQSVESWRKALEVNVTAPFLLTQALAPLLRTSGHGSVIHIGSIYGIVGPDMGLYEDSQLGNPAAYGVSKAGLLQLTRWLATVLAPEVRVNMISMGGVFRNQGEPFLSRYKARTPLQRMATEDDIKGAALYLAGDASRYVTGQNLVIDGGWTAW